MSHTQGPWKIRRLGPAEHYAIETEAGQMIAATAVTATTKEDAQLMAAAPELLAALKAWREYEDGPALLSWYEVSAKIDAAIAKAEGKQ